MKKVLLIGGVSTIGQFVARNLVSAGIAVSSFSEEVEDRKIIHNDYRIIRGDVNNILALNNVLEEGYDAVINTYPVGYLTRLFYVTDAVQNILKSMQSNHVDRLLFFNYGKYEQYYFSHEKNGLHLWSLLEKKTENRMKRAYDQVILNSGVHATVMQFDFSFLKDMKSDESEVLLKKYFLEVARQTRQQLMQPKSSYELLTLTLSSHLADNAVTA